MVEHINGREKVHHDRQYTVMINAPPYEQQLENLKQYRAFGGDRPLPSATDSKSRFVRASYYRNRLPEPKTEWEAVALPLGVLRNVSAPFEAANKAGPDYSPTQWRIVTNLTDQVYYFESLLRLKLT